MSINSVVLVGNLTRDPELGAAGATAVCRMRLAVNDRVKDKHTGEWGNRPNYFDVDVFGRMGENCAQYLRRGNKITVEGKLRWREWETQDGSKRQAVSVVASEVEFPGKQEAQDGDGGSESRAPAPAQAAAPTAGLEEYDDDIPF